MTYEIEITRNNVTPAKFFCRNSICVQKERY